MLGFLKRKREGDEELDDVLLFALYFFFSRPIVHFSFASREILRETVSDPRLTHMDVTVINKDYVGWYLQSVYICKAAENFWE